MINSISKMKIAIDLKNDHIKWFIILFVFSILAKGTILYPSYAIDDYKYSFLISEGSTFNTYGGRLLFGVFFYIVQSLNLELTDVYFPFAILTLLLHSIFLLSAFRFLNISYSIYNVVVSILIITHPYLIEILTFKMTYLFNVFCLLSSVIILETLNSNGFYIKKIIIAILFTLAITLTYQIFINYLFVIAFFSLLLGGLTNIKEQKSITSKNIYYKKTMDLFLVLLLSVIIFYLTIKIFDMAYLKHTLDARGTVISLDDIPNRLNQIFDLYINVYWTSEPLLTKNIKVLLFILLITSNFIILIKFAKFGYKSIIFWIFWEILGIISMFGIIVFLKNWWPVPRVISHLSLTFGLLIIIANSYIDNKKIQNIFFSIYLVLIACFILINNQTLADQRKMNKFDQMLVNRIFSRVEMNEKFNNSDIKKIFINQSSWRYPINLITTQGDMNMSALAPLYSRVPLIKSVTGYDFTFVTGEDYIFSEKYCESKKPWPHIESTFIKNDFLIICLQK